MALVLLLMSIQSQRITVCLVASSPCANDRTTNVWEDEIDKYFERYPGSYRGECASEGEDTCQL